MAETARFGFLLGFAALLLGTAGAHADGDLGRAEPPSALDRLLTAITREDSASSFNQTDAEIDMANRLWRFVTVEPFWDWWPERKQTLRPANWWVAQGKPSAIDRYYGWLHATHYQSASVRYASIADDIEADLDTIPGAFASICAVAEVDRERRVAAANLPNLGPGPRADILARRAENGGQVDAFVGALRYRYQSYGYALDHLLVETPDPAARLVDDDLAALEDEVRLAEHGRFCGTEWDAAPHVGNPHPAPAVPSRFVNGNPRSPAPASGPAAGS